MEAELEQGDGRSIIGPERRLECLIAGRTKHLEKEIKAFKDNVDKLKKGELKLTPKKRREKPDPKKEEPKKPDPLTESSLRTIPLLLGVLKKSTHGARLGACFTTLRVTFPRSIAIVPATRRCSASRSPLPQRARLARNRLHEGETRLGIRLTGEELDRIGRSYPRGARLVTLANRA